MINTKKKRLLLSALIILVFLAFGVTILKHKLLKQSYDSASNDKLSVNENIITDDKPENTITDDKLENAIVDDKSKNTEPETSISLSNTTKNINPGAYDSFLEFPFNYMVFSNDEAFKIIKESYSKLSFTNDFKQGDLGVYDYYAEKFSKLVKSEVPFYIENSDKKYYVKDCCHIYDYDNGHDVNEYTFYFFDIDTDNIPELGIDNHGCHIFKYITEQDRFIQWYDAGASSYNINGSLTLSWNNGGMRHSFYKLDKNGGEVYTVFFFCREDFNTRIQQAEVVFMVSLPRFANADDQFSLSNELIDQGYFDKGQQIYYFRVTEEQYDELTRDYLAFERQAKKDREEVSFTYKELFSDFDN